MTGEKHDSDNSITHSEQTKNVSQTAEKSLQEPKIKPFLIIESVKLTRFVYKAGYNYKKIENLSANFYFSSNYTEADLFLFYELRGSRIQFNRYQVKNLVWYKIPKIEFNYFNILCYEFNK